MDFKKSMKK